MLQHQAGHRERLRARMLENPAALPDYELLELLLGCVIRRGDTKPLAKELLSRFDSLRGALDAKEGELLQVPGFGPALYAFWVLFREAMARHTEGGYRMRDTLCGPAHVAKMAKKRLGALSHEEVWAAYTDSQTRLIAFERVVKGTFDAAAFHQRDVVGRAYELKALGIILVHNHPGGDPKPSGADKKLTNVVRAAAESMDMQLLDHVIITDYFCYSFTEDDLIGMEE